MTGFRDPKQMTVPPVGPSRFARCLCGQRATNQPIYERDDDGTRFMGPAVCDAHAKPVGRLTYAKTVSIVDHYQIKERA